MSYLVLDTETTTTNSGHPFTLRNKLCTVGLKSPYLLETFNIEYDDHPFGAALERIQEEIDEYRFLVGFNLKFDLHWLRRYGIVFPADFAVHDCQLGYFLLTAQEHRYPSLNEVSVAYGFGEKDDRVDREYWSQGIDTPLVPYNILDEYLRRDLDLTERVYLRQRALFEENPKLRHLFSLQCQDLLVLEEMEWNGLLYDKEESLKKAEELEEKLAGIRTELSDLVGLPFINWGSPEQVSKVLYGGVIKEQYQEEFLFHYKDDKKEPVWKKRWQVREHLLPRLVEPLKNSAKAKDGIFSTSETTLLELKATGKAKKVVQLLLSYAELDKLNDYFKGIPKLIEEMEWEDNVLHGQLNQCNVVTGRLSSNAPNQQNMPEPVSDLIRSRF